VRVVCDVWHVYFVQKGWQNRVRAHVMVCGYAPLAAIACEWHPVVLSLVLHALWLLVTFGSCRNHQSCGMAYYVRPASHG
jgi:hypothetical protein